jgi:hypothetical protein
MFIEPLAQYMSNLTNICIVARILNNIALKQGRNSKLYVKQNRLKNIQQKSFISYVNLF